VDPAAGAAGWASPRRALLRRRAWSLGAGLVLLWLLGPISEAGAQPGTGEGEGEGAAAPLQPEAIEAANARYAREPSAARVVRLALAEAGLDPRRIDRLILRARRSAWLPELRLGARRGMGRDASAQAGAELDRLSLSSDESLGVEASLRFRLDRLVYGGEEVALLRERRAVVEARRALIAFVIELYFLRRRLQLERDLLGLVDLERAIRIREAEALLDAFTGGRFSRMLQAARAR